MMSERGVRSSGLQTFGVRGGPPPEVEAAVVSDVPFKAAAALATPAPATLMAAVFLMKSRRVIVVFTSEL